MIHRSARWLIQTLAMRGALQAVKGSQELADEIEQLFYAHNVSTIYLVLTQVVAIFLHHHPPAAREKLRREFMTHVDSVLKLLDEQRDEPRP